MAPNAEDLFAPNPVNVLLMSQPHFLEKNVMETMLNLDFANHMSAEDPWDFPVIQDPQVSQELTVFPVPKDSPAKTEHQENKDPSDLPDVKAHKGKLDPKVILVSKVFPDLRDLLVLKDPEVVRVNVVKSVPLDLLVLLELLVITDRMDPQDPVAPTDKMVFPEALVPEDLWDLKVCKEFPERLDLEVFPDPKVNPVPVDNQLSPSLCPLMLTLVLLPLRETPHN